MTKPADPVPAFESLVGAIERSKLPDSQLLSRAAALRTRALGKNGENDAKAFIEIYAAAIELATASASTQRVGAMETVLAGAFERALTRWPDRVTQQKSELSARIAEAVRATPVSTKKEGEATHFEIAEADLRHAEKWVGDLEATWITNNANLFVSRATEEATTASPSFASAGFTVAPPAAPPPPRPLALRGTSIETPNVFAAMGAGMKLAISVLTAAAGFAAIAAQWLTAADAASFTARALAVTLALAIVYAIVVLPGRRSRAIALATENATKAVRDELTTALEQHVAQCGTNQLDAIRRQTDVERHRWIAWVRDAARDGLRDEWSRELEERVRVLKEESR